MLIRYKEADEREASVKKLRKNEVYLNESGIC